MLLYSTTWKKGIPADKNADEMLSESNGPRTLLDGALSLLSDYSTISEI